MLAEEPIQFLVHMICRHAMHIRNISQLSLLYYRICRNFAKLFLLTITRPF